MHQADALFRVHLENANSHVLETDIQGALQFVEVKSSFVNIDIDSREKITKPKRAFQLSLGATLSKFTTFLSAPQILF